MKGRKGRERKEGNKGEKKGGNEGRTKGEGGEEMKRRQERK